MTDSEIWKDVVGKGKKMFSKQGVKSYRNIKKQVRIYRSKRR